MPAENSGANLTADISGANPAADNPAARGG